MGFMFPGKRQGQKYVDTTEISKYPGVFYRNVIMSIRQYIIVAFQLQM